MLRLEQLSAWPGAFIRQLRELMARERAYLTNEILHTRGLMDLLMKQRNGQRWTKEEKHELAARLRRLTNMGPHLVVLAMPGGMLLLPVLAWWLDRRRTRDRAGEAAPRRSP